MVSPLRAGFFVGEGATGATFLKIPTSARAASLSGAFSSISGDVSAIEYNPAGLSNLERIDLMATYLDYIEDTSLQAFSAAFPISLGSGSTRAKTASNNFNRDKMQFGMQYKVFRAEDTERSSLGVKGDSFDIRDQVLGVALAYPLSKRTALGITGKFIGQTLHNESANNYAVDAGVQYKWEQGWSLGASVQNLGPSKAFIQEKDPLPALGRVGINKQWRQLLILAEGTGGRDKIFTGAAAAEWEISRYVRLRGGARHDTTLEFSGGLGVRFDGPQKAPVISTPRKPVDPENPERKSLEELQAKPNGRSAAPAFPNITIGLDYGLSTHKDLGLTHTVSLRILY